MIKNCVDKVEVIKGRDVGFRPWDKPTYRIMVHLQGGNSMCIEQAIDPEASYEYQLTASVQSMVSQLQGEIMDSLFKAAEAEQLKRMKPDIGILLR